MKPLNLVQIWRFAFLLLHLQAKINVTIMIERSIQKSIVSDYTRKKIIVLLGPRQVGKTTLLDALETAGSRCLRLNCDDIDDAMLLENKSSTELKAMFSGYDMFFVDEAQRVKNIGLTLKKLGDLKLSTKIIVTGSSSLDLANDINEPATGRLIEHTLYPFSMRELAEDSSEREQQRMLENRLIYGLYPEVVTFPSDGARTLMTIANNYLYKDILSYRGIKKPDILQKLVRALALQLGAEVSYNELANMLGVDKETIENYISLLEKCFVVFRLDSFSRNLRNEIKKGKKIYFYDNGIRNAVLSNFAPLDLRNDVGALWENFMVSERIKYNSYRGSYAQVYFWRTHDQKEIDLVELENGIINSYEFKWNTRRMPTIPSSFQAAYPEATYQVITPENMWSFI